MLKSLFKEYKIPLAFSACVLFALLTGVGSNFLERYIDNKFNAKLMSVCAYEIKAKLSNPDSSKFDYSLSYVVTTSNPNIWLVTVNTTAENESKEKMTKMMSCRMRRVDGNLQVDRWGVID